MLSIVKRYMKIYESTDYSIISVKSIMITILFTFLLYTQINNINKINDIMCIAFSIITIMFSCNCINNESFIDINSGELKKIPFYKKIIASNICCFLEFILYVLVIVTINIYFFGYIQGVNYLIKLISLIICSLSLGNFLLVIGKKQVLLNITNNSGRDKNLAIMQNIKLAAISIVLGLILNYVYYDSELLVILLISLIIYIFSILINRLKKTYL